MVTPLDEIDRINERLFRERGDSIVDRDSYDIEFLRLFEKKELNSKQQTLRNKSFRDYADKHDTRRKRLFKEAGGKSLERDRRTTARTVVTDEKQFIKKGARRVDFKGLDTQFVFRSTITRNNKKITVFRDKKGRFAKR